MEIAIGEKIPLIVQLFDGKSGLPVLATLFDDIGKQIDQVMLQSFEGGLYLDNSRQMPPVKYLVAKYEVVDSSEYGIQSETIFSINPVIQEEKAITGEVIAVKPLDHLIFGEVVNEKAV